MCLEEFIYVALEETQNDKIVEIIDHINESGQHLSFNVKTPIEANNNNNKKKQRPTNHKQSIRDSNSFIPPKELRYVIFYPFKIIIDNYFEEQRL